MDYNQILGALSNMAPRDPAAPNPATTEAMARSRDAVTKILERSLARQSDPFSGLNDVATAATAALATRGRTPFGMALEQAESARMKNQLGAATSLSQVAQREAAATGKGGMTPYQSAQFSMRQLQFLASRGDKDASLANQAINQIRTNLEPEDAVGFVVDAHAALQEAQRQAGRPLSGEEAVAVITRQASGGGYKAKQTNLQLHTDAYGNQTYFDPRTGARTPVTTPGASTGPQRAPAVVGRAPPVSVPQGAPPPGPMAGEFGNVPQLSPSAPGAAERAQGAASAQASNMTPAQRGTMEVKRQDRERSASFFRNIADATLNDIRSAGAASMGPLGWLQRVGGAAVEQVAALGPAGEFEQYRRAYAPMLDSLVQGGAQSAGIKAGMLSIAYAYSKAMDESGVVNVKELDYALKLLGEATGSPAQAEQAIAVLKRNIDAKNGMGAAPAQAPAPTTRPNRPPAAGDVDVGGDGKAYQFNGGDPADPRSWTLIR